MDSNFPVSWEYKESQEQFFYSESLQSNRGRK